MGFEVVGAVACVGVVEACYGERDRNALEVTQIRALGCVGVASVDGFDGGVSVVSVVGTKVGLFCCN